MASFEMLSMEGHRENAANLGAPRVRESAELRLPKTQEAIPTEQAVFARRLKEARLEAGLSQARLAELAGLDRTYVSHLERGLANPSLLKMSQLARIVGRSVADLLRG